MNLSDLSKMVQSVIIGGASNPREEAYESLIYAVRQQLSKQRITLQTAILKLFQYEKEKFTREQLAQLFEMIGVKIGEQQLSILMENMDPDDNKFVFVGQLNKAIGILSARSVLHSSSVSVSTEWIGQLASILRSSGPYQTLQIFDDDADGSLTVSELTLYIESTDLGIDRKTIHKVFFRGSETVQISEILRIIGISPSEQFCQSDDKSERCSLLELSVNFDKPNKSRLKQSTISSKAETIRQYLNPYADLEEPLASLAVSEIRSMRTYFDKNNPGVRSGLIYKHAQQLFKGHYFLFELQKSVIRKGMGTMMDSRNIIQGKGKDCYLLSAVAGLVELYPEFIYRLFVLDKNPSDIYGVRLFIDGQWQTIILDAHFPVDQRGILYYAKPYRSQIWVLLLEKAWAKAFLSYDNIESGNPEQGLTALTGAPCLKIIGEDPLILSKLAYYLKSQYIVTANTSEVVSTMNKTQQKALGIYQNHAYTVVALYENVSYLKDGKQQQITLMKMRNPWGKGTWKGDWSFDSNMWTPDLRMKLGYIKDPKNGTFFIGINDFLTMFGSMKVCQLSPINVNNALRITCKRKELVAAKIQIVEPGIYFFSIYQQSERRAKAEGRPKKIATSHILLTGKAQNGATIPIVSKTYNRQKTHIEAMLSPGQYTLYCRIKWQNEQDTFNLGSYGPSFVQMSRVQASYKQIFEYVFLKSQEKRGEVKIYDSIGHPQSYRISFLSHDEGIGYVTLVNNSRQIMKTEVRFNNARGITALKPGQIPIRVAIQPGCIYTQCMLVDPKARFTIDQTIEFV